MSVLLEKIRNIDTNAANHVKEAGFRSDSEIRSLTREDLQEMFPGLEKTSMRKRIFETISNTDPTNVLLTKLKDFIPRDNLKAALSNNGVLVDYFHQLKDMQTQLNNVQKFLEANIRFLEESRDAPSGQETASASTSNAVAKRSDKNTEVLSTRPSQVYVTESSRMTGAHGNSSQSSYVSSYSHSQKPPVTVKYKMVVSGKTFNANGQILDQIRSSAPELNLVEVEATTCVDDSQITLVFCPIVSRVGTDVEAAMKTVPGDKPVILLLMHHVHEVKYVPSMRTWPDHHNIVLHVNVFYHEKVPGLIVCQKNVEAITAVKNEILKYGITDVHSGYLSDSASLSSYDAGVVTHSLSQRDNQSKLYSWNPMNWSIRK
uniref:Si:ch211-245h14.1 n=2 Tax=Nothobranchius kuhntae TaxID=321403 RepID=A0A1A8KKM7_NOTKU